MIATNLNRFSAFGIHLGTSIVVFSSLTALVILWWFPRPLFETDGGWDGLKLVALVDLVLGPLLTLVIYKPGKPGLARDMTIIVLLQVLAFVYGAVTVHGTRPAFVVFADDSLQVVPLSVAEEMSSGTKLLERFEGGLPHRVALDVPTEPLARAEFFLQLARDDQKFHLAHDHYVPLAQKWSSVVDDSLDIHKYVQGVAAWEKRLERTLADIGSDGTDLVFLPLVGRLKSVIIVADAGDGRFLDSIDIPYVSARLKRRLPIMERIRTKADQATD